MTLTLRTRLAMISAGVFGLVLAGLSIVSYQVLARWLDTDVTERLSALTTGLHGYLRLDDQTADIELDVGDDDAAAFVHEATRYYQVYDLETGQLIGESTGVRPLGLHLTRGEVATFRQYPQPFDIETDYGRLRFSNSIGKTADGRAYLLQVGVPLSGMDTALARYRDLLWLGIPLTLIVALAASWWLSSFALLPLARVADAARGIDVHTLERRLPVRGARDELDQVVGAFNTTLARLALAVDHMRQFSAAMAHELRTPLAGLRGAIDLAWRAPDVTAEQRDRLASQLEEIDRLTRLIDHILTLSRAESGQIRLNRLPVDLAGLAVHLVDQLEPVAAASAIALRCEAAAGIVVQGDEGWLQRLILNLVGNALKFTGDGGEVVVRVSRDAAQAQARLAVQDSGIGLSPEDAPRVFERFFRADAARSPSTEGAGLGLSLVHWIVEQHHGTVTVESQLGVGSTFVVTLPLART
jgi:heavy metal sensor kinase